MNSIYWTVCRWWVKCRRGREPPLRFVDPIWYFAYGSNMNERLFRERRHMTPIDIRIGKLTGYRLCFTIAGGRRPGVSAPANITEEPESTLYGILYLLPLHKFVRLDASEGRQYDYLWIDVDDADGVKVPAVTFKVTGAQPEGRPSLPYLQKILKAAQQRSLPSQYLEALKKIEPRE